MKRLRQATEVWFGQSLGCWCWAPLRGIGLESRLRVAGHAQTNAFAKCKLNLIPELRCRMSLMPSE